MGSSNAELAVLTERRRVAAEAAAQATGLVPVAGEVVVTVRGGVAVVAGAVAYARGGFVVVRCGDGHLQAFDVEQFCQGAGMWSAEVL